MGFIEANKSFFKRYVDFEGRSAPSEMWWPFLLYWIVFIACYILVGVGVAIFDEESPMVGLFALPLLIWWLAVLIPGIAVRVRRFHDQDKSGWMYLLRFIPLVGGLVIIIFMCMEGTRGTNRFGPSPKMDGIEEEFI